MTGRRVVSFSEAVDRMSSRTGPTEAGKRIVDEARAKLTAAGAQPTGPPAGIDDKARAILADGRIEVRTVRRDHVHALVHGDNDTYAVTHNPRDGWVCGCPAGRHGRRCSHLVAVELVTTARRSA